MANEFNRYHPIVNFLYFFTAIGFSMVFMHPICLIISLAVAFLHSVILIGKKSVKFNFLYMLPLIFTTAIINPLLNHEGMTILWYFPTGNPLTLEAISYGIAAGIMLWSVICHFSCFNIIMTSDKLIYLFGKITPSLSLVFSMVLRFVPHFKSQLTQISSAQKSIGKDVSQGNILIKLKNVINIMSIMITRSLESAIDTADSMKSRGYGLPNRTAYSNFIINKRDIAALAYIVILSIYIIVGALHKAIHFNYFPVIKDSRNNIYSLSIFIAYFILLAFPIVIEIMEVLKWKRLKSKI